MIPPPYIAPTAQNRRAYLCRRATEPLELDGRLDKPFWANADWTEDFVDIEGDAKPRPPFRTRTKVLWDDRNLYIGAEMEETHVWGSLTQRDSIVYHDNDFEVFLSPTGDNHNYYELEVNALNTIFDLFLPKPYRDGGPADHAWDAAGLRSAVHVDGTLNDPTDRDRGWSVELAVPWAALDRHGGVRCPPRDGDQWRMNFSRVQWDTEVVDGRYRKVPDRPEQNWVWSPQGIVDMHRPEQWGTVQFCGGPASSDAFTPDHSAAARDSLHRVYYAQARFHAMYKRWSPSVTRLAEIDANVSTVAPPCLGPPRVQLTPSGWIAFQNYAALGGRPTVVSITHDSRVATSD